MTEGLALFFRVVIRPLFCPLSARKTCFPMTISMRKFEKDAKKGLQYLSYNGIIDAVFCKKGGTL